MLLEADRSCFWYLENKERYSKHHVNNKTTQIEYNIRECSDSARVQTYSTNLFVAKV